MPSEWGTCHNVLALMKQSAVLTPLTCEARHYAHPLSHQLSIQVMYLLCKKITLSSSFEKKTSVCMILTNLRNYSSGRPQQIHPSKLPALHLNRRWRLYLHHTRRNLLPRRPQQWHRHFHRQYHWQRKIHLPMPRPVGILLTPLLRKYFCSLLSRSVACSSHNASISVFPETQCLHLHLTLWCMLQCKNIVIIVQSLITLVDTQPDIHHSVPPQMSQQVRLPIHCRS